jgi:hypothetical protein
MRLSLLTTAVIGVPSSSRKASPAPATVPDQKSRQERAVFRLERKRMPAAIHHVSVADGEAFLSASRLLFGPITQRFPSGTVPSIPKLVSVHLGACRLSEITANPHLVLNDELRQRLSSALH